MTVPVTIGAGTKPANITNIHNAVKVQYHTQFLKRLHTKKSIILAHYTNWSKRVMSGRDHHRASTPGEHGSNKTSQWWWAVGGTASDLNGPGIKPRPPHRRGRSKHVNHYANGPVEAPHFESSLRWEQVCLLHGREKLHTGCIFRNGSTEKDRARSTWL